MPETSSADTTQQLVNQTILSRLEKKSVLGLTPLRKVVLKSWSMTQK